jgi:hypothetical protein
VTADNADRGFPPSDAGVNETDASTIGVEVFESEEVTVGPHQILEESGKRRTPHDRGGCP